MTGFYDVISMVFLSGSRRNVTESKMAEAGNLKAKIGVHHTPFLEIRQILYMPFRDFETSESAHSGHIAREKQ